jgi:hypothetical protein
MDGDDHSSIRLFVILECQRVAPVRIQSNLVSPRIVQMMSLTPSSLSIGANADDVATIRPIAILRAAAGADGVSSPAGQFLLGNLERATAPTRQRPQASASSPLIGGLKKSPQ